MFPGRRGRGRAGGLGAGRGARGPAPCLPGVLATGGRAGGAWTVGRRAGAEPGAAGECGLRAPASLPPSVWVEKRESRSGPASGPLPGFPFSPRAPDAPPPRVSPAPVPPCLPADTLLLPGPGLPLRRRRAPRARPGSTLVSRPLSLLPPPLQLCPGAVLAAALPPPLPAQPGKPASRSSAFRPSGGRLGAVVACLHTG